MRRSEDRYVPALSYAWLTPLYDPVVRMLMRENAFRRRLITQARVKPGHKVLDVGCGTGSQIILLKKNLPYANVVGLDGDPSILAVARSKIGKAGLDITLDVGMSYSLPYHDQTFDRVFSSLMFHHLSPENKMRTFKEILRVLRPGAELHAADFGKPTNLLMRILALTVQRLEETRDNVKGLIPDLMGAAGFRDARETERFMTAFGSLSLFSARKAD